MNLSDLSLDDYQEDSPVRAILECAIDGDKSMLVDAGRESWDILLAAIVGCLEE